MTQEEKDLVLRDLCARLPYDVIGLYSWKNREPYNRDLTGSLFDELKSSWDSTEDSEFLPYIRPMSSMTKEEEQEYRSLCAMQFDELTDVNTTNYYFFFDSIKSFDWLNAHHFDYRGLIHKGLAIEVTEENNQYKD